ncbi:MAG TPA: protein-methionine-sulfoxide reductase catalytic subunit MsrP [Acetobacteraceae bacterium]|nr:protein-methionine-sulfoxide reductase catalytic subunit MsrP [Acetobacteraceae bacterium]
MLIRKRQGWEIGESAVTPEATVMGRRALLAGAGAVAAGMAMAGTARAAPDPRFPPGRPITPESDATTYNNYYEFAEDKDIWEAAQKLPQSPWTLKIDGLVEKPRSIGLDDLVRQMHVEERVYRHRCVEAWSMVVPWTGFTLKEFVAFARPLGSAKYVRFQTIEDDSVMPGLSQPFYPWPYIEALTMQEAMNELPFMVTGMYGKKLPPQNGGPLRVHIPWKYGFKSGKALVRISFVEKRPDTFWATLGPSEYGFWANVNPAVPHPRWSQATERVLGTNERVPTVIWNGYGTWVAAMYADKTNQKLFM